MSDALIKFEEALKSLLSVYSEQVEDADLAKVLEHASMRLRQEFLPTEYYFVKRDARLIARFYDPDELDRELENLLVLQAICIPLANPPAMMTEIDVVVDVEGHENLAMPGRVVHVSGDQVAIQTFLNDHVTTEKLRALPQAMRSKPPEPTYAEPAGATPQVSEQDRSRSRTTQPYGTLPPSSSAPTHPGLPTNMRQSGTFRRIEPQEIDPREGLEPEKIDLVDGDILPVLVKVASERVDGILELLGPGKEKLVLTLREGCLIEFEREPARDADQLEVLLAGAGKLSPEEIATAVERAKSLGTSVADALLDLRLMEYGDLRVALKTRLIFMARQLWSGDWNQAALYEYNTSFVRTLAPPIPVYQQLFSVTLKHYESNLHAERVETIKSRFERVKLALRQDLNLSIDDLGLSTKQRRFIETGLSVKRQIADLLLVSPMGQNDSLAMLAALDDIGLLEKERVTQWTHQLTRQRNQLELMMLKIDREDHFDVLGLHWSAYDDEVEKAYHNAMTDYALEKFSALEAKQDIERIHARLTRAYEHLKSSSARREYREREVSDFKLRSSIDMFRKQAEFSQMRRELENAIDFNRRILELSPRDKEARAAIELLKRAMDLRDKGHNI